MRDDVYVVGSSWLDIESDNSFQLDEAVFAACSAALQDAGVKRHQVGFSVTSSLDLYDARSISSALTAPAAAGYLNDEIRVEGDATASFLLAAASLASGQCDFAIVTAVNMPEVNSTREDDLRRLREQISSYTFDSHVDRPIGMSSMLTLGLHASARLEQGSVKWDDLVDRTAEEINRGSGRSNRRPAVSREDVANAPMVADPLSSFMLPAETAGVGAVVLSIGRSALRCPSPRARLAGWGTATGPATSNPSWLENPSRGAAKAARDAYARAGLKDTARVAGLEMMDHTPALTDELVDALSVTHLDRDQINVSGGVRSSHPGIASGLLRIIEATDQLSESSSPQVVHTADDLMGLVSQTTSVLVLEAP